MNRIAALALAAALAVPAGAEAQARLLLGGGLSNPNGDMKLLYDSGIHGRVGLQVGVPVFPVSLRAEGELHRLPEAGSDETTNMLNGTLSGVLSLGGIGLSPYVIAGVGRYRRAPSGGGEAITDRGIHGGFGASIGALGFGGFVEVRLVNIDRPEGDLRYVPLTVGFRF